MSRFSTLELFFIGSLFSQFNRIINSAMGTTEVKLNKHIWRRGMGTSSTPHTSFNGTRNQEDEWRWIHDGNGGYSTKTGYKILLPNLTMDTNEEKALLNKVWNKLTLIKVSITAWRALCNNRLATKLNLYRRNILSDNVSLCCPFCNEVEEDVPHLFFVCKVSYKIWMECYKWFGFVCVGHLNPYLHFESYIGIWSYRKENEFWESMWSCIIWSIWYMRNSIIFRNEEVNLYHIVELSHTLYLTGQGLPKIADFMIFHGLMGITTICKFFSCIDVVNYSFLDITNRTIG